MAEIAEVLHYPGGAYVDKNMAPVDSVKDLNSIPRAERFEGMTVTVLNDDTTGIPTDYWLVGGVSNSNWRVKRSNNTIPTKAALATFKQFELYQGFEVIVTEDEDNDGQMSKYWLTGFDNAKNPIWERKEYFVTVGGSDIEHE